jgi:predicted RNA-binding protein with PIN domain
MDVGYVIDGYNLMFAIGILAGKVKPLGLERARLQLQEFLVSAPGDDAGRTTLVFDAASLPARVAREQTYKGLKILLAVGKQQAADERIEALIAQHPSPRHLIVVSSDHRLQTAARRKGAQAMNCTEFQDFLDRRRHPRPAAPNEPEKKEHLSEKEIHAWLQEFAGLEDEPDLKEAFERYDFEKE